MNKIKQNLAYCISVGLGILNFIFFAIPYVQSFYSYDYGAYGKGSSSTNINGYEILEDMWKAEAIGVLSALIQVFVLIGGICLLAYGVAGLLKEFGYFEAFPSKIGNASNKKVAEYALYVFVALNVLELIFLIILCATNTEKETSGDYWAKGGIRLSAGIFLTLIFAIGGVVALKLLEKKIPQEGEFEQTSCVCTKCGRRVSAKVNFCYKCGGKVEKRVQNASRSYVCSGCGSKANLNYNFCPICGDVVVAIQTEEPLLKEETVVTKEQNPSSEENEAETSEITNAKK